MPQTSYSAAPGAANLPGMKRTDPNDLVGSGVVQTAAGVYAGRFVKRGTSPTDSIAVLAAAGDVVKICGVTLLELTRLPAAPTFARYDLASYLKKGLVYMTCVGAIAQDAIPFIIYSGANAGLPSVDAAGGTAKQISGVRCIVGAADGAAGLFELDTPLIEIVVDTQ